MYFCSAITIVFFSSKIHVTANVSTCASSSSFALSADLSLSISTVIPTTEWKKASSREIERHGSTSRESETFEIFGNKDKCG